MMRTCLIALTVLLLANCALAGPYLTWTSVSLGGGLKGHTFKLVADGTTGSWAADMTYTGLDGAIINQVQAYGTTVVDLQVDADSYHAIPAASYDKQLDSWVYSPFDGINGDQFVETANSWQTHIGSGSGSSYADVDLTYVVADGLIGFAGTFSREGIDYSFDASTAPGEGDANGDNMVTLLDYTIWAANYAPGVGGKTRGQGDLTGDGEVTLVDYTVWAAHYGEFATYGDPVQSPGAPSAPAPVPEPLTVSLLAVGTLALIRRRK